MLKMIEGLKEKMQNEDGFWTEEFELGFYAYINKNGEIDVCNEQQKSSLESYGYKVIWIATDKLSEDIEDVIVYIDSQISTLDVKQTIKNLIAIEVTESFKNEVICAFDTTEKEVIVNRNESNANIDYQAYENLEGAPIICIKIEDNKITDAWEA